MSSRIIIQISCATSVVFFCLYLIYNSNPGDQKDVGGRTASSEVDRHPARSLSRTAPHAKSATESTSQTLAKFDEELSEKLATETVENNDPENVIKIINSFPNPEDSLGLLAKLFPKIAGKDPDAAVRLAGMLHDPKVAKWARALIITTVANSDPEKALNLANSIGKDRIGLHYENIFKKWVQLDPKNAMDNWSKMIASPEKDRAAHVLVDGWANQDPQGLLDYVTANPGFSFRREAMSGAIAQLGKINVSSAMKYIKESNLGDFKIQLASTLIKSIDGNADVTQVISWVKEMPGGGAQDAGRH